MKEPIEIIQKLALKFVELPFDKKKEFLNENSFFVVYSDLADNILLKACSVVTIHELSEAGRINLCRKILVDTRRLGIEKAFDEYEKLANRYQGLIDEFFSTKSIFRKKEILLDEPSLLTLIGLYFLNEKSNRVYAQAAAEIRLGSQEVQEYQAYRVLFIRCFEFGIDFAFDDFQKRLDEPSNASSSSVFDEIIENDELSRSIAAYTKNRKNA